MSITIILATHCLMDKDNISYHNGYEADQEGDQEDSNAIEIYHRTNRATTGLQLASEHGRFCVHQETPAVRKGKPACLLLVTPFISLRGSRVLSEVGVAAYPCFWLKFW